MCRRATAALLLPTPLITVATTLLPCENALLQLLRERFCLCNVVGQLTADSA
jgi:hypothetical protein